MEQFETLTIIGDGGATPRGWKVILGGRDISASVVGIKINAFIREVVDVELHLRCNVDQIEIQRLRKEK